MRKGLELIVEEPVPGQFYWFVLGREVFGEARRTLDRAPAPYASRRQAVDAGATAISRHMEPKPLRTPEAKPGAQNSQLLAQRH